MSPLLFSQPAVGVSPPRSNFLYVPTSPQPSGLALLPHRQHAGICSKRSASFRNFRQSASPIVLPPRETETRSLPSRHKLALRTPACTSPSRQENARSPVPRSQLPDCSGICSRLSLPFERSGEGRLAALEHALPLP